ncbi:MAG: hypothetical protein M1818_000906 [Claussenomyces sp. TS43310]|nr:MAG: hypothetical protein M1818_000906 [Claussenomyces sp. TS43310]
MLFPEEEAPQLKKWIVKRLENTSDADADVLADYVLALLRHDGDTQTVRALCEQEIPDFLKEDSSIFVRDVFDAINYRSYIPGARPPPVPSAPAFPAQPAAGPLLYGNVNIPGVPTGPQSASRKRLYGDRGDGEVQGGRDFQYSGADTNGRSFKQPRRGGNMGRGGRFENYGNGRGTPHGQSPSMHNTAIPGFPPMPSPPLGMPQFDPNNPMAAMLAMQAMGFPVPGMPGLSQSNSPVGRAAPASPRFPSGQKVQRCRDYDTKGFCARGNSCKFEHGNDSIYVPPAGDEYDPSTSLIPGLDQMTPNVFAAPVQSGSDSTRGGERGRGRGRGQRGDTGNSSGGQRGRGGRAGFSSDRPNFDRTKTTIVVENIPEEKFSEEAVREFFSEFGTILDVTMKAYKHLAIVKYTDWNAAKAAYSSPKVIFDNRFVKVYWYSGEESLPRATPGSNGKTGTDTKNGIATPAPVRAASEPQLDAEEFARKQEEAQKVHEEKMKKKVEMEARQKELEKRQEELLKSQAEEKRKLMERLAAKSGRRATPATAEQGDGDVEANRGRSSQTDALKAQLAALEAEAKSLGLDPTQTDDASWAGRGRGRGGYRGRGTFVPRGARGFDRGRGSYRGRGGAPFGGSSAYKLDNRPKKIALTGVDFTEPDKDESLRQYLLGVGEFTDLESTPTRTSVTFRDRFTAEKFMYGTPNGEIPSVGKVDMAWVQTPLPPVDPSKFAPPAALPRAEPTSPPGEGIEVDEGDAMSHGPADERMDGGGTRGQYQQQQQQQQQQHQELDYDVADDDWGVR